MRVLHVIPSIAPRYGGPSSAIGPMATSLQALGVGIEIATTDADGSRGSLRSIDSLGGVPVHMFRREASEQWKVSTGLWGWIRSNARRFDLIHVHSVWNFPTAAACLAARSANRAYIVRPCGMLSEYTWNRCAMKKRLYWLAIERRNLQNASAVHATSDGEGRDVRRLGLMDPSRIFAIPLGIDPMGWTEDHQPDRLRKLCGGRAGDRPIILYLSRLHPKKGIVDLLLPAMARLKSDAFLAIVGASDERTPKYDTEIRAEVERLGIASRIAILGGVAACDRWTIFDGAVGFVLPSHNENFGIVVVEAMARGLPVVVTDAVQAATQVRAAGAGHVVPFDADALADRLDALVAQPSAARSAGQAGQEYVRKHLGWEGIAGEISTMYRSCLI